MNEYIGTIINYVAVVLVMSLITWWYNSKHKRKVKKSPPQKEECSQGDNTSQGDNPEHVSIQRSGKDIVYIIWTFFDEMELACELSTEKDSVECFTVGFDGENGEIMMRVYVMTDRDMYQIIGQRKTFVPESNRDAAIRAINRYNMQTNAVSGCISEDSAVTFWIGRYTEGGAFSVEAFAREFGMVLAAAEDTTTQILNEVIT